MSEEANFTEKEHKMAAWYEVQIHDLQIKLQVKHHQAKELQKTLQEREEEIAGLRNDYREIWDTNQYNETEMSELKHQLSIKENECKKHWSDMKQEVLKENQQLKEELGALRNKFENLFIKMNQKQENPKEDEIKENLPKDHEFPFRMSGNIEQLVFEMIAQHAAQIKSLKQQMNENIDSLQSELEKAIADKESLTKNFVAEIERLNLALDDATNKLAEYDETANDTSDSEESCINLEIQVPTSAKQSIDTNVFDEEVADTKRKFKGVAKTPEQYGRWIEAKDNEGLAQVLSPLADLDDDYIPDDYKEITIGGTTL